MTSRPVASSKMMAAAVQSRNASSPMVFSEAGSWKPESLVQPVKAPCPIVSNVEFGRSVTVVRLVQP